MKTFFRLYVLSYKLNYIKLPAILYWEEKHYVVLDEISPKGNDFTIIDPAYGRRKIRLDEFLEKYSGFVLEYSLTEDFVKKKKKYRFNFFLTHVLKHKKILLFLLFTSLVLQGIGLIMPKLTQWVIDQIILTSDNKYINLLGMSVLILYLFYQSFSVLRGYFFKLHEIILWYSNNNKGSILFTSNTKISLILIALQDSSY